MRNYSSRWGKFKISGLFFHAIQGKGTDSEAFRNVMVLMREILIFRAHSCPASDEIEYIGISPLFDELAETELIPEYFLEGQLVEEGRECPDCHGETGKTCCQPVDGQPQGCGGSGLVIHHEYVIKAFKRRWANFRIMGGSHEDNGREA